MDLNRRIGENARTVRKRLGLSQAQFAALLRERSVSGGRKWKQKDISALETGKLDKGTWRDLWDLSAATGLDEAWWVSHEVDLRDLTSLKPLYLHSDPIPDLDPVNLGVTDPDWFYREPVMYLPNPDYWSKPLQHETLPLKVSA